MAEVNSNTQILFRFNSSSTELWLWCKTSTEKDDTTTYQCALWNEVWLDVWFSLAGLLCALWLRPASLSLLQVPASFLLWSRCTAFPPRHFILIPLSAQVFWWNITIWGFVRDVKTVKPIHGLPHLSPYDSWSPTTLMYKSGLCMHAWMDG